MARDMRFPCSTKPCRNHVCLQKTFREGLVNGQRCRIFSVVIEGVFLIHLSFAFLAPQNMALRHPIAFDVYDPSIQYKSYKKPHTFIQYSTHSVHTTFLWVPYEYSTKFSLPHVRGLPEISGTMASPTVNHTVNGRRQHPRAPLTGSDGHVPMILCALIPVESMCDQGCRLPV